MLQKPFEAMRENYFETSKSLTGTVLAPVWIHEAPIIDAMDTVLPSVTWNGTKGARLCPGRVGGSKRTVTDPLKG
jgi:hypothetical protein